MSSWRVRLGPRLWNYGICYGIEMAFNNDTPCFTSDEGAAPHHGTASTKRCCSVNATISMVFYMLSPHLVLFIISRCKWANAPTTQNNSQYQQIKKLGTTSTSHMCWSSHKSMILTNETSLQRESNKLCFGNKDIIDQTQWSKTFFFDEFRYTKLFSCSQPVVFMPWQLLGAPRYVWFGLAIRIKILFGSIVG